MTWCSCRRVLADHRGSLARYPHLAKEFATERELRSVMRLTALGRYADGALYRVDGLQPGVR